MLTRVQNYLMDAWPTARVSNPYDGDHQSFEFRPVGVSPVNTTAQTEELGISSLTAKPQLGKEYLPPSLPKMREMPDDAADAAVLQLWEGRVLSVDDDTQNMRALLSAKMGQVPDHTAQIELQWVSDQDLDLVKPGAVFYLTLYKQVRRGSIKNSQELRFRRRPSWSQHQIQEIRAEAQVLASKMKARPLAE